MRSGCLLTLVELVLGTMGMSLKMEGAMMMVGDDDDDDDDDDELSSRVVGVW